MTIDYIVRYYLDLLSDVCWLIQFTNNWWKTPCPHANSLTLSLAATLRFDSEDVGLAPQISFKMRMGDWVEGAVPFFNQKFKLLCVTELDFACLDNDQVTSMKWIIAAVESQPTLWLRPASVLYYSRAKQCKVGALYSAASHKTIPCSRRTRPRGLY